MGPMGPDGSSLRIGIQEMEGISVGSICENDDGSTKSKLWSYEVRQRWPEMPESLYEVVDLDLDSALCINSQRPRLSTNRRGADFSPDHTLPFQSA
jgi:hypothetical protein